MSRIIIPNHAAAPEAKAASLARLFLFILAVLLFGYALFGRGFAYLGMPPVYIGEVGLLFAVIVLYAHILVPVWESRLVWFLFAFMLWCAFNTVPYISAYGMDALRDGASWGYGLFSIAVATSILATAAIERTFVWYGAFAKAFLLIIIPSILMYQLAREGIPNLPWGPGDGVKIINPKGGLIAVHLSGIAVLYALDRDKLGLKSRIWLILWIVAAALVAADGRAAFLTITLPLIALMILQPHSHWRGMFAIMLGVFGTLFVFDIHFEMGREGRSVSADTFISGIISIISDSHIQNFSDTKEWRLMWWNTIIDYTIFGEYFWTGKGFGINLATSDGFQVFWDQSLRSPHNGHLTFLARAGVPGLIFWLFLQAYFACALFYAYQKDLVHGRKEWSNLSLWILLYWLAFMVNANFDILLEGPHGAISFWSLFGLGLAHLMRRRFFREAEYSAITMPRGNT